MPVDRRGAASASHSDVTKNRKNTVILLLGVIKSSASRIHTSAGSVIQLGLVGVIGHLY